MAGAVIEVKYFNTFVLKKTVVDTSETIVWNGSFGIPAEQGGYPVVAGTVDESNWAIEESRIRGGYNNTNVDYGVRAYLVEEEPNSTVRFNSLIYSGIFNSRTGINNTNVFSTADDITKSADPANASIQKLYAEEIPAIPLYFRSNSYIIPKWLKGIRPTGHMFTSTNWIEDWYAIR